MDVTQSRKPIPPYNDLLSKKMLGSVGNEDITAGFIEDFLGIRPLEIHYANPYDITKLKDVVDDPVMRHTEVDVLVTLEDNTKVIVEMQVQGLTWARERALYLTASRFSADYAVEGLSRPGTKNHRYSSLYPTYSIHILIDTMFDDASALHHFVLHDLANDLAYLDEAKRDLISLTFFETAKDTGLSGNLEHWRNLFLGRRLSPDAPVYINRARQVVTTANLTDEEYRMLTAQQRYEADLYAREEYVRREGREEGLEQGRIAVARNMLADGFNPEAIARYTGLDPDAVRRLSCP